MHQDYTSLLNLQNSQKYYHQNSLKESLAIQSWLKTLSKPEFSLKFNLIHRIKAIY